MRKLGEFKILKRAGGARAGRLVTAHGVIKTPVFMPVGTQGSVKALDPEDIKGTGAQIILANTYHLYLRPGGKVIDGFGGLHQFMGWKGPILTDSGGYQVSSLGWFKNRNAEKLTKITDSGVVFKSHLDGSEHFMTPELATKIQQQLNTDIMMTFDEATPLKGRQYAIEAMDRTQRWLKKCIKQWGRGEIQGKKQLLFGIVQGGNYRDLRRQAVEMVLNTPVSGVALGGATIGRSINETAENAAYVMDKITADGRPVYFMGVGVNPSHAIGAVLAGADMFDCVAPTKLARCGLLYHGHLVVKAHKLETANFESEYSQERLNIEKKIFANDSQPIDDKCDCATCRYGYSRAYLHHLFKARELLYYRLATIHNVRVMVRTVDVLRQEILDQS